MIRIGLITPYNGTNLGDQAILDTIVSQLQLASMPGTVEFICICLNPARVTSLHGIPAFPVTGLEVAFYSTAAGLFGTETDTTKPMAAPIEGAPVARKGSDRIRDIAKALPGSKALVNRLRGALPAYANVPRDLLWCIRAWRMSAHLNCIVVSGGGQVDEEWGGAWGHPYSLFRWATIARLRGIPFVVASVGVCKVDSRHGRRLFKIALRSAKYLSCRDEKSVELANQILGESKAIFVPDIVCSLDAPGDAGNAVDSSRGYVLVSPIAFGLPGAWPTQQKVTYHNYICALAECVSGLMSAGHCIKITTTSSPDGPAVEHLLDELDKIKPDASHKIAVFKPGSVRELLDQIRGSSVVIASRLHGVMLSHISGRPVVAISFDRKVDAHMAQFGQAAFCIDIFSVTAAGLRSSFDVVCARRDQIRQTLEDARLRTAAALGRQTDVISRIARVPSANAQ